MAHMFPRRNKRKPLAKAQRKPLKRNRRKPLKKSRLKQPLSFTSSTNKNIKRLRKKRFKGNIHITRKIFFKRFFIGLFIASATIASIYFIFFSQIFNLKKWEIVENDVTFYNHYLDEFIEPHKDENLLFLDTDSIVSTIRQAHPNFSTITVNKKLPNRLVIQIDQYPLLANIINIVGEEQIEQKIIINSIGIAVEKDVIDTTLPTIKISTKKSFNILEQVLTLKKLTYITEAIKEFEEAFGIKITTAEYKIIERELHLHTEKGFTIWLDMNKSSETQFLKLKRSKLDLNTEPIDYIDLRIFGAEFDKVIYKRR